MNTDAQRLCLECGLCCNGVIFARGELRPGEDSHRLRALGFKLRKSGAGVVKFSQPCPALECGACRIYQARPQYCREFDCALLKRVVAGGISAKEAARITAKTRRLAVKAGRLLRKVGDSDEQTALSLRFRRVTRRIEEQLLGAESSHTFSELTITMHRLNVLLGTHFYPGA